MSILLCVNALLTVAWATEPVYSLPWQLRPLTVGNVVRSDTSLALYEAEGEAEEATLASTLLASYALAPSFAPLVRVALVHDTAGDASATALVNPMVGGLFATQRGEARMSAFFGATLPVGMGGDGPAKGIAARSGMDNALFAVNYLTLVAGAGAGWLTGGATLQGEVTLLQLFHVRGPSDEDALRTNLTAGLHAGYAWTPWLSVGSELRHQRWLSTPTAVSVDPTLRDTTTLAVGPRLHLKADEIRLRPGISYALPLDAPLAGSRYHMLQLDVPVVF